MGCMRYLSEAHLRGFERYKVSGSFTQKRGGMGGFLSLKPRVTMASIVLYCKYLSSHSKSIVIESKLCQGVGNLIHRF